MEKKHQQPMAKRPARILVTTRRIALLAIITTALGATLITMSIHFTRAYPGAQNTMRVFCSSMFGYCFFTGGCILMMGAWMLRGYRWHVGWTETGEFRWVLVE
jgi:hypothetical protein